MDTKDLLEDISVGGDDTVNFFADDSLEVEVKKEEKPAKIDNEEQTEEEKKEALKVIEKEKEEKKSDDNIDFFGAGNDDEEEEEEEDSEKEKVGGKKGEDDDDEEDDDSTSISSLNYLKEKGLVEFELGEDEELTEEKAAELLEDSLDQTVEKALEDKLGSLPDPIKELNKFVLNGGDPSQFLSKMAKQASSNIKVGLDMTEESNQEMVMRETLSDEGYDKEYIDTQIDFLKDSKKLEAMSGSRYKKWEKDNTAAMSSLAKRQAAAKIAAKQQIKDNKVAAAKLLKKGLDNVNFDAKEAKELPDYMYTPEYRLENGREITEMEKDLMDALKDQSKMAVLAKMLKSGFDFESFKVDASDKVSKTVRQNLQRKKRQEKTSGNTGKDLASYFD